MPLFWTAVCSVLPALVLLSALDDGCLVHESSSSQYESPLLRSLRCHNNYKSQVLCSWSEVSRRQVQLWFKTQDSIELCEPYLGEQSNASERGTLHCRYNTGAFAVGINHTAFFLGEETSCSVTRQGPLELSQHLRARTPLNLSTHEGGNGDRLIIWSSPYSSSSSLDKDMRYQLSYRTHRQEDWMMEDVSNTSFKLERQLPGHRYEARVRAQARVGQWSNWSPVVTWRTEHKAGDFPRVHCLLDGEKEVICRWEVSRETADIITYQPACLPPQPERCCTSLTVTSDSDRKVLMYSCSITVEEPENLLLELQPMHNAKTFEAHKHIRPNPPQQLKVREKGNIWKVEWTDPSRASTLGLSYQVCYQQITEQECSQLHNVSAGSMSLLVPDVSLVPSQRYRVKVRSLLLPREDSMYRGIPSEWSESVEWISHQASWSPDSLIYFFIAVLVVAVFILLYCTIPACRRRIVLWVDSVPSPGKSKILMEIKSATGRSLIQDGNTLIFKVQDLESLSTCSSLMSLWQTKDGDNQDEKKEEEQDEEQDEGCWSCENPAVPPETANSCESSSMSFSGPYIFCQSSKTNNKPVIVQCKQKEEEKETLTGDSGAPSTVNFLFPGGGYVSLPGRNISRSAQDLMFHSNPGSDMWENPDQKHQSPESSQILEQTDLQAKSTQHPHHTSVTFNSWPQGGAIQASGYCHIPSPHSGSEGFF